MHGRDARVTALFPPLALVRIDCCGPYIEAGRETRSRRRSRDSRLENHYTARLRRISDIKAKLGGLMSGLNIRKDNCRFDFLSLGAMVHRLDPGPIPFRKARSLDIHVSGGEYNVAANLSDAFGLKTAIATAMVKY